MRTRRTFHLVLPLLAMLVVSACMPGAGGEQAQAPVGGAQEARPTATRRPSPIPLPPSDVTVPALELNVTEFGGLSREHVDEVVTYPQTPPAGGPHNPRWQNCGIYDQPIENEPAVHSLEHGAVWITYQPDLPAADVEKLRSEVRGHSFVLLSPYTALPSKVVASAWGVQLKLDSASDTRIAAFIEEYERGSQTPEPGAICRSGVGTPVER